MTDRLPPSRESNPFSTCWTDDRRNGFVRLPQLSIDDALVRLESNDWRGQIVGPHGVGKSALLREIARGSAKHRPGRVINVTSGDPRSLSAGHPRDTCLFIEGFERLAIGRQVGCMMAWSWRRQRVIVTTHRRLPGLPVTAKIAPQAATLRRLFDHYTNQRRTRVTLADAEVAFARSCGNLRETWFELHLLHEQRSRGSATARVRVAYS